MPKEMVVYFILGTTTVVGFLGFAFGWKLGDHHGFMRAMNRFQNTFASRTSAPDGRITGTQGGYLAGGRIGDVQDILKKMKT